MKQGYNHFGNAEEWIIENNSSNRILEMIGKEKEYLKMTRESHTKSRPNTMSKQNDFYRVEGEEDQEDTLTVEIRTGMNESVINPSSVGRPFKLRAAMDDIQCYVHSHDNQQPEYCSESGDTGRCRDQQNPKHNLTDDRPPS